MVRLFELCGVREPMHAYTYFIGTWEMEFPQENEYIFAFCLRFTHFPWGIPDEGSVMELERRGNIISGKNLT